MGRYEPAASDSGCKVGVCGDLWADGLQVILLPQIPPDLLPVNALCKAQRHVMRHLTSARMEGRSNNESTQEYAPGVQSIDVEGSAATIWGPA